jgi:hypothetical protein
MELFVNVAQHRRNDGRPDEITRRHKPLQQWERRCNQAFGFGQTDYGSGADERNATTAFGFQSASTIVHQQEHRVASIAPITRRFNGTRLARVNTRVEQLVVRRGNLNHFDPPLLQ